MSQITCLVERYPRLPLSLWNLKNISFPHLELDNALEVMLDAASIHLSLYDGFTDGNHLIGYARLHAYQQSCHVYVDRVCISPGYRGMGLFPVLVKSIEERLTGRIFLKARFPLAPKYQVLGYRIFHRDADFAYLSKDIFE